MKITIYGAGYVGLVSGTCLAELGHEVLCVDIDKNKVAELNQGNIPIYEPQLATLLNKNRQKKLFFTTEFRDGVHFSDIQFICVNTPTVPDQGADISNVLAVAKTIALYMEESKLIINKSTAPIGTVQKIKDTIEKSLLEQKKRIAYEVASNPEFLKEGAAVKDFMEPDRIIVGTQSLWAKDRFAEIYAAFTAKLIFMDIPSAELTKYTANAMLAAKISFMNEIAQIADAFDADIEQVKYGISLDPRIGPHFIEAGAGYGGSCFPKDVRALSHLAKAQDIQTQMLDAIEQVNEMQKQILFKKIQQYFKYQLENKKFALWGLAFKPNTDDMREASSLVLIQALLTTGAKINAYDPVAMENTQRLLREYKNIAFGSNALETLSDTDALIILTEWDEFKKVDLALIKTQLNRPLIFDGRNIFPLALMEKHQIEYYGIGRKYIPPL